MHGSISSDWFKGISRTDFEAAFRKGFWRSVISWMTRTDNKLLPFDEVKKRFRLRGQHSIGLVQVPLEKVVGSVGRYHDFDSTFLPRQRVTQDRWMSIDEAHLKDIHLPAIGLYKLRSDYYVIDGNHRVSVARERGQKFIDAHVIEIDVDEQFDKGVDLITIIRRRERAIFQEKTRLGKLLTDADIKITVAGGYNKLLEHINVHRWFMGERSTQDVSWKDAVMEWYQLVYSPLIKVIRENKVLRDFPERTEADLYLWIIEHLWYLREEYQKDVSLRAAASHFKEEYSQRSLQWIHKLFSRMSDLLGGDNLEEMQTEEDSQPS